MSNKNTYTQCLFKKDNTRYTAWIPSIKAKKGKKVSIKGIGENLEIVGIFDSLPEGDVIKNETNYRRHRNATDV